MVHLKHINDHFPLLRNMLALLCSVTFSIFICIHFFSSLSTITSPDSSICCINKLIFSELLVNHLLHGNGYTKGLAGIPFN